MTKVVIALAGCTNGGKSSTAAALTQRLQSVGVGVSVVAQDAFYRDSTDVPSVPCVHAPTKHFLDYDCPESVDSATLVQKVQLEAENHQVVFVEGNMLTELPDLLRLCHHVVFFTLPKSESAHRRATHDYSDLNCPPDDPGYFDEVVWPAYARHLKHAQSLRDQGVSLLFLDGTEDFNGNVRKVEALIHRVLETGK